MSAFMASLKSLPGTKTTFFPAGMSISSPVLWIVALAGGSFRTFSLPLLQIDFATAYQFGSRHIAKGSKHHFHFNSCGLRPVFRECLQNGVNHFLSWSSFYLSLCGVSRRLRFFLAVHFLINPFHGVTEAPAQFRVAAQAEKPPFSV